MRKSTCGGGKGGKTPYDPMIAQNIGRANEIANRSIDFSEKYFNDTIKPLLQRQSDQADISTKDLHDQYNIQNAQAQQASDRYNKYGIPAENAYYERAARYSEPQYAEQQAGLALGDLRTAQGNQNTQQMQQYASLGIDPTSPAAISAMSNQAILNSAAEAGALTRTRMMAGQKADGWASDAANFGRGGQSGILQFGAGASGNAQGAFGIANSALSTGQGAGQSVMQGYANASNTFGHSADTYGSQANSYRQAQAASSPMAGLGALAGSVLSKAKFMSDIRSKENITQIGVLPSGIKVYEYDYKPEFRDEWGHGRQQGVIAQEVAPIIPEAVIYDYGRGYLIVDYAKVR